MLKSIFHSSRDFVGNYLNRNPFFQDSWVSDEPIIDRCEIASLVSIPQETIGSIRMKPALKVESNYGIFDAYSRDIRPISNVNFF